MVKFKTLMISTVVSLLALNSCVKEPEDLNNEQDLSCLLTSYSGEGFSYNFSYDNKKRLTNIYYYSENYNSSTRVTDFSDGDVSEYVETTDGFDYYKEKYIRGSNSLTIEYYYNHSESFEFDDWFLDTRYRYTYDSQNRIKRRDWYKDYDDGNGLNLLGYRKYSWTNGNISSREYWYADKKSGAIDKELIFDPVEHHIRMKSTNDSRSYVATYSYDNKSNAFASMGNYFLDNFSKNNPKSLIISYDNGSEAYYEYEYEYNDRGFPYYRSYSYTNTDGETFYYTNNFDYQCD